MSDDLLDQLQESEREWAEIEKTTALRSEKDKKIISRFCAENDYADIKRTLDLLKKHQGLPQHDRDVVKSFESAYPDKLTVLGIHQFIDVRDIYGCYLESGGESDD